MSAIKKVSVLGVPVAVSTYADAVRVVRRFALESGSARLVEAANTHVVTMARHDAAFGKVMDEFDYIVPDGMPLVWSMNRKLGGRDRLVDRVYGPTLMLECFESYQGDEEPGHFLLGGKPETLEKLKENLGGKFPGASILGSYSPPFGQWPEEEKEKIIRMIRESGAKVIWVGLGCPKQEILMAELKSSLPPGVYLGIGAAFAFHAGEVRQAPAVVQRCGMEWAFRLAMEPRRLFARYFKYNLLFIYYTFKDRLFKSV